VEAPISMDDIARVAAAPLVKSDESHFGRMYPITGPEALTRARYIRSVSESAYRSAMSSATEPEP
jgi:uncharacterized protein YbjT (DUF2867 family)